MTEKLQTNPVTIWDVARVAGVSKSTVSAALTGTGRVSAKTKDKVESAARELGFVPNPHAQRLLRKRDEQTIGFFSLDLDLGGRTRQLQIIQAALNDLGYDVPIYACGYRGRDNRERQMKLLNALLSQRPRAVVFNASGVIPEVLERLERHQIEEGGIVVCYSYDAPLGYAFDQVILDPEERTYLGARALLELGHRDIGFFNVGQRELDGRQKRGFERALAEFGAQSREEWLFGNEGVLRYEEEGVLLAQKFLALSQRPSAMLAWNDYAALAFVTELVRAGVKVPDELSVIGYGNSPIARHCIVPLSTIAMSMDEVAAHVVELLTSRLDGGDFGPRRVFVREELIQRDSSAPFQWGAQPDTSVFRQTLAV